VIVSIGDFAVEWDMTFGTFQRFPHLATVI
jgi:hypothetical protein